MRDFALSQPETEWLGVLGFSVGGATAIRGAARMPEIKAVIAEGNYANFYDELTAAYAPSPFVSMAGAASGRVFLPPAQRRSPAQDQPGG